MSFFRSRRGWTIVPLILIAAGIFALLAWARPQPRIAIEPSSQDLGEVPQQHLELTYTVRNVGTSALHIGEITTTCGCTTAAVEKTTVLPGESTLLRVTMDPQTLNLYGDLYRAISVQSDDPATPEAKVDFHVTIPKPDG